MALSQSAVSELWDAFRAGDGLDLIRESVRVVLQELIEAEATEVIGAGRHERTETRVTDRNGSRPRLLTTKAGDVALSIPKLRAGSFFPSVLEPRRRIDQALYAVVMEAYVHGVSTRAVDDLVVAMGGRGSPRARCHGSVPAWTRWLARSGPGGWTTPSFRTSFWTRRTCTCGLRPRR
jgi:putative transposase